MEQTDAIQQVASPADKPIDEPKLVVKPKKSKKADKVEADKAEAEADEMAEMREMMKRMKMENEALRKEKEEAVLASKKASKSWMAMDKWIKDEEKWIEDAEAKMVEERNKFELLKAEMEEVMEAGEAEMVAWLAERSSRGGRGRTAPVVSVTAPVVLGGKGVRTNKNRDGCLDILMNGMRLRASGTIRGTGETTTLEVVYDKRTKSFYGEDTRKDYLKLQDANREWCEARGLPKLGNAWEDFKAVRKDGAVKSIEHIWKEEGNWIKDADEADWVY
jgi:hypothetical protein